MGTYRGWGGPSYRVYGGGGGGGGFGWLLTPIVKKLLLLNVAVFVVTLLLQVSAGRLYPLGSGAWSWASLNLI